MTTSNPLSKPSRAKKRPAKKQTAKSRKPPTTAQLRSTIMQRSISGNEDDEVIVSSGFGRCGGRALCSVLEQTICDRLSAAGLTHSHSPRHFEVPIGENVVGAYAPLIVLRGRGRGGKTVVIECAEEIYDSVLDKIIAFRTKFGSEFYVVYIAPEEILDLTPVNAYDESSVTTDLGTLINRLAS